MAYLRIDLLFFDFGVWIIHLSVSETHSVGIVISYIVRYFLCLFHLLLLLNEDLHLALLLGSPELVPVRVVLVHDVELRLELQIEILTNIIREKRLLGVSGKG